MSDLDQQTRAIFQSILRDIQVELGDEFDQNFERQAFFSQAWQRRKSPTRPGGLILVDSGGLRQLLSFDIKVYVVDVFGKVLLDDCPDCGLHLG